MARAAKHAHSVTFSVGDTAGSSVLTLNIPYDREVMWLDTDPNQYTNLYYLNAISTNPGTGGAPNKDPGLVNFYTKLCNGLLQLECINRLTHSQSEVPDANLVFWVSAGPDYQIARPITDNMCVGSFQCGEIVRTDPPSGTSTAVEESDNLTSPKVVMHVKQRHPTKVRMHVFTQEDIRNSADNTFDVKKTFYVQPTAQMGESFVHIKQQMTRKHLVQRCTVPASAKSQTFVGTYVSAFDLCPYQVNHAMSDAQVFMRGTDNKAYRFYDQNSNLRGNPISYYSHIFACAAGSFVVTVLNVFEPSRPANESAEFTVSNMNVRPNPSRTVYFDATDDSVAAGTLIDGTSVSARLGAGMMVKPINAPQIVAEATIPFFDRRFWLYTPDNLSPSYSAFGTHSSWTLQMMDFEGIPTASVQAVIDPGNYFQVLMSAGDDFHLGFLTPPKRANFLFTAGIVANGFKFKAPSN
jgi:hypothetical protein